MERRGFLKSTLTFFSWGILSGLALVPGVGHLLSPVLRKSAPDDEWHLLGTVDDFPSDSVSARTLHLVVRDGWERRIQEQTVFVLNRDEAPMVLSSVCPHLSCPVNFDNGTQQFHCPCHQSFWKDNGARLRGPSPRNLDPLPTQIRDGQIYCRWVNFRPNLPEPVEV